VAFHLFAQYIHASDIHCKDTVFSLTIYVLNALILEIFLVQYPMLRIKGINMITALNPYVVWFYNLSGYFPEAAAW